MLARGRSLAVFGRARTDGGTPPRTGAEVKTNLLTSTMGAPTIWTVLACTMLHACSAFTAALGPLAASAPGPLAASAPRHSAPKCTNVPGGTGLHSRRAVLLAAAAAAGVSPAHAEDMANRAALLDSSEDHNANGAPDKHTPTVKLVSSGGSSGEVCILGLCPRPLRQPPPRPAPSAAIPNLFSAASPCLQPLCRRRACRLPLRSPQSH